MLTNVLTALAGLDISTGFQVTYGYQDSSHSEP